MDTAQAQQIANTTLAQMGGRSFLALTGGSASFDADGTLTVRLKNGSARKGINYVTITLDANDTYSMTFGRVWIRKGNIGQRQVAKHDGLYCDNIQDVFEAETGLYVTLAPRVA